MLKFSIIIPVCGQEEMTKKCVESIKKNSSDYELIIVDNGSVPNYQGPGEIIRSEKNAGFPIAVNQGIKKAIGEIIIILNNDVIVTPGWLDHFADHLKYADIVGPVTNEISGPQKVAFPYEKPDGWLNEFAINLYKKNQLSSTPFHRLVFFCVAIKREVIDKIGLLDERFTPGNFEDDDFCLRAIEAGFHLVIAEDVFVYHYGSVTHRALKLDYSAILTVNKKKFEDKWPVKKYQLLVQKAQEIKKNPSLNIGNSIALVMIVKNEEKGLKEAILSAKPICDEIVIAVDDSSTDKTLEIARQHAKMVKTFTWADDFAAARNFAHSGVKSKWILFMDGHEVLKNPENVKKYLNTDHDGLMCRVRMESGCMFPAPRIYRNGLEFVGQIHELPEGKNFKSAFDIIIQHERMANQNIASVHDRVAQRNDLMPQIMGKRLAKNKKDTTASFHLGMFYLSRFNYKEGLRCFKLYIKHSKSLPALWFIHYHMALCYLNLNKKFSAWLSTCAAYKINPNRWEIAEIRGYIFFKDKDYKKALTFFMESMNESSGEMSFRPKEHDLSITWNYMGECFFNLGKFYEASEAFMRAQKLSKKKDFKKLLQRRANLMREMSLKK